jgi:hypothetical protein
MTQRTTVVLARGDDVTQLSVSTEHWRDAMGQALAMCLHSDLAYPHGLHVLARAVTQLALEDALPGCEEAADLFRRGAASLLERERRMTQAIVAATKDCGPSRSDTETKRGDTKK